MIDAESEEPLAQIDVPGQPRGIAITPDGRYALTVAPKCNQLIVIDRESRKVVQRFGVGYDFEVFGKVGLNLDFGVLWQGEPEVTLESTGLATAPANVQALLLPALEAERLELEDEMSDFKAWPVVSLAFVYNF